LHFKLYFEKLKLIQKIEIYILVVMFYGTLLYFYDDIMKNFNQKVEPNKAVLLYQQKLQSLSSKIVDKKDIKVISFIENNGSKYNVFIETMSINQNRLNIKLHGKFDEVMNLLHLYQTHMKIISFKLFKYKEKIYCELQLDNQYFFNKDKKFTKLKNLHDPFLTLQHKMVNKKKVILKKDLKLMAIVSNEVLINGSWYRLNDIINNSKIVKINQSSIELQNIQNDQLHILKVNNE